MTEEKREDLRIDLVRKQYELSECRNKRIERREYRNYVRRCIRDYICELRKTDAELLVHEKKVKEAYDQADQAIARYINSK